MFGDFLESTTQFLFLSYLYQQASPAYCALSLIDLHDSRQRPLSASVSG